MFMDFGLNSCCFLPLALASIYDKAVKKRGLSIRYKVLLLLTSIPLLMLTAYLLLAKSVFVEDKVAYVFDVTSSMSGTLASQIKIQLNSTLSSSRTIFQDYLKQESFSETGRAVFENESFIETVLVFKKNEAGDFIQASFLEKSPGIANSLIEKLKSQLPSLFVEMGAVSRVFKVPFGDDLALIIEKVEDTSTGRVTLFFMALRLSELSETFKGISAQKIYLVSSRGDIWMGPEGAVGTKISQVVQPSFLKSQAELIAQGAETLVDNQGRELLVSFSRAGFADLYVVTTVEKEKALSAVQVLIRKSLVFLGLLLSITTIISLFASSSLTSALTDLFSATQKVSEGDFNIKVQVRSNDEVGSLAENFNVMAAEVSRLLEQTAEKARMESELNTARTVQETLFPESKGILGPLSVSGFYEPASECGGDWWHYCKVGDKYFLWIGDATGHGVPAALITAAAKSASTIIERLNVTPDKALALLNRSIYEVSRGRIMMTFFLASYDANTRTLTYANASHEAPYLIKKSDEPLKKKSLIPLNEVTNPRLGQAKDTVYQLSSIQLDPEDIIFFYTDGIPDIQNPGKESWGEREFLKTLVASFKDYPTAEEGVQRFVQAFSAYRQKTTLVDDVTFFVVKNDGAV